MYNMTDEQFQQWQREQIHIDEIFSITKTIEVTSEQGYVDIVFKTLRRKTIAIKFTPRGFAKFMDQIGRVP